MQNKIFSHWFRGFQQQACSLNERRLIALVGERDWASALLRAIDSHSCDGAKHSEKTWLVYGDSKQIKANVNSQRFRDKLGSESDFIIFNETGSAQADNSHQLELSIDAFAALSGTLVAGGVFFLLINHDSYINDGLFNQRFFKLLTTFSEHIIIKKGDCHLPPDLSSHQESSDDNLKESLCYNCVTQEQLTAVEAIIKVVMGKRNRPLVLTADRGRGKSSALAIACGQLLKQATKERKFRIIITAADVDSLSVFYKQLALSEPDGVLLNTKFTTKYGVVEFLPIDQLLHQSKCANLVLVDEAAAIPIYLLEQLLSRYSRLVFSSTIHGYEGAGRGFTLKFQQTLTSIFPHWRALHIQEPIRWRVNDPLEKLVFDACLLNAELPALSIEDQTIAPSQLIFKLFSAKELVANEALFKQTFAILVTAHYQTKPSDVQLLLDNPRVQLVCLLNTSHSAPQVIAVALLIHEGQFQKNNISSKEVNAIKQSQRRLKNHFVPQSLLTHCGIEYAFDYHYLRLMRIAVHPQRQHQGVGQFFLTKIADYAVVQGVDFLASSFGATKALLAFWLNNQFKISRIGFSKDKASGEQSALVLKALSNSASEALTDINAEFYRTFDYLLQDEYKYLPSELIALILHHCPRHCLASLSERDIKNNMAFSKGHRQFSTCSFSLHLWLKHHLIKHNLENDDVLWVLISRILQKRSIDDVCKKYGFTGKKALEKFLQSSLNTYLDNELNH